MIHRNLSPVAPPPSLADILSAGATQRLGSVDFATRPVEQSIEPFAEPVDEPAGPALRPVTHLDEPVECVECVECVEAVEPVDEDLLPDPRPSVDAVAATVIARMRATEDAARRHLEAIETEAARRCELVTAQAELDAELIRLHARREAHAIIAAARMRAGGDTGSAQDSQRLHEIGETFSRFAESLETTGVSTTGTPDPSQKP